MISTANDAEVVQRITRINELVQRITRIISTTNYADKRISTTNYADKRMILLKKYNSLRGSTTTQARISE